MNLKRRSRYTTAYDPTPDPDRCTGRTTKQMLDAPIGAVFISCHYGALDHDRHLAVKHGRPDLKVFDSSWITSARWQGQTLTGIVIDHAAKLTQREGADLRYALTRVR